MAIADSMGLILFLWIVGASALLIYFSLGIDFRHRQTNGEAVSERVSTPAPVDRT
jgi:hypothetical protein